MSNSARQSIVPVRDYRLNLDSSSARTSVVASTSAFTLQPTAPVPLAAAYMLRVVGLALPYVFTFLAVIGGDLHSPWVRVLFHPIGQFILAYTLVHIAADVCFYFHRGSALIRTINGVGAVLCVAVSPLWLNLLLSGSTAPDALWTLIGVPLEFVACVGFYAYAARRIG